MKEKEKEKEENKQKETDRLQQKEHAKGAMFRWLKDPRILKLIDAEFQKSGHFKRKSKQYFELMKKKEKLK